MAEGDSLHRTATALRTALVGKTMTSFSAPRLCGPVPSLGRTIETVRARGKHLEVIWDDGLTLHTHLRFTGSWHLYHPDERWRKGSNRMRVAIEAGGWVAVCFNAPVVETYRQFDRQRHPGYGRLGPDLSHRSADLSECVNRVLTHDDPDLYVCELLLDQHVACGIGNVDRSEILWATKLSPFACVGDLEVADVQQIVAAAARLLRANRDDAKRSPVLGTGPGLNVYGRNGQRCSRCGDTIQVRRVGDLGRLLYWCQGCQSRLDSRPAPTPSGGLDRPMDPHPAATMYLSTLPWNRDDDETHRHADTG